jgi:hypothetical protein
MTKSAVGLRRAAEGRIVGSQWLRQNRTSLLRHRRIGCGPAAPALTPNSCRSVNGGSLRASSQTVSGCEPPRHDTEDAVERLYAAGLLHRVGQFVFVTRAAHNAQRLAS